MTVICRSAGIAQNDATVHHWSDGTAEICLHPFSNNGRVSFAMRLTAEEWRALATAALDAAAHCDASHSAAAMRRMRDLYGDEIASIEVL